MQIISLLGYMADRGHHEESEKSQTSTKSEFPQLLQRDVNRYSQIVGETVGSNIRV
jgi:hypothetical protein